MEQARGRVEKTEIVEMAIKYINHLRENNKSLCTPEAAATFKNLTFGGQILDSGLKMNTLSSINLNQFKEESEQSNASLQSSLQNSINLSSKKQQFAGDSSADDYLNGARDCYTQVFKFLATTPLLQTGQPAKERLNEQLIIDLKAYLDANLIKSSPEPQQQPHNSLAGKRRVDFSPKSSSSIQSVDGLQIKLEEMDVEESSCRMRKQEKLNFEDKFNGSKQPSYCGNLSASKSLNAPNGLSANLAGCKLNELDKQHLISKFPSGLSSATLKNYLTNNELLKSDYLLKSGYGGNLDLELNPSIKSRSLTSSPNSSNLDGGYKFKSSIKEKFDAESNIKVGRSESDHNALSRPRSATVGANASSIRRLNPISLDLKEKIGNSIAELNAATCYEAGRLESGANGKSLDSRLNLGQPLQHPPPLPKSNLVKRTSPGFVLHPYQPYYVPIEIDLNNLMTHFTKPNQAISHPDELLSQLQSNIAQHLSGKAAQLNSLNACSASFLSATNGSQNSLNQFSEHLSYSSPSLSSLNSLHNSSFATGYLQNASLKCCLDDGDKLAGEPIGDHPGVIMYPISISVNFKFPPLSLSAILNAQNSQKSS